jgi:hypothetical protein
MVCAFLRVCPPCTDDSNHLSTFDEADDKQPFGLRVADDDFSLLLPGMIPVSIDSAQAIIEHRLSLVKRHAMLPEIPGSLGVVPLEDSHCDPAELPMDAIGVLLRCATCGFM